MYPEANTMPAAGDPPAGLPEVCPSTEAASPHEPGTEWFALRTMYCNDMNVGRYLEQQGIQVFIPLHYVNVTRGSIRRRELEPIVRNLVFARTTRARIDRIKETLEGKWPIRLFMDRTTRQPIHIPPRQMDNFIRVAGQYNEDLVYVDEQTARCKVGDVVRIKCGAFAGTQGKLIRVKGHKRVLVAIEGFVYVTTTYIPKEFIEIVKPEQ